MKIHFIGTCAGTEPMPTRKHSSTVIETNDTLYWFDAGEGCSYTAHNMGLDLLKTKEIVISHPHMDHVGGLGNLLWNIRKLRLMRDTKPFWAPINIRIPNEETAEGIMKILRNTETNFECDYDNDFTRVHDGVIVDDTNIKVTAYHNCHLEDLCFEPWQSFSYKIELEGKKVVYSGDVASYTELDELIGEHCDALIIETGHFVIQDVYEYTKNKNINKIFFTHNGREIIFGTEKSREKVKQLFGCRGTICEDGMSVQV